MKELGVRHVRWLPSAVLKRLWGNDPGGLHCLIWILKYF